MDVQSTRGECVSPLNRLYPRPISGLRLRTVHLQAERARLAYRRRQRWRALKDHPPFCDGNTQISQERSSVIQGRRDQNYELSMAETPTEGMAKGVVSPAGQTVAERVGEGADLSQGQLTSLIPLSAARAPRLLFRRNEGEELSVEMIDA